MHSEKPGPDGFMSLSSFRMRKEKKMEVYATGLYLEWWKASKEYVISIYQWVTRFQKTDLPKVTQLGNGKKSPIQCCLQDKCNE